MIVSIINGDIFQSPNSHIAFAVNTNGYNDDGFAGFVSRNHWRELACTGEKKLGEVLTKKTDTVTFHALVCHSLTENVWNKAAETITKCLDSIDVPDTETIAIVLIGSGMIGQMTGANQLQILTGMANSKKKVAIYYR